LIWATWLWTGKPKSPTERKVVALALPARRAHVAPWEVSKPSGGSGQPHWQQGGRGREKSAEAIVVNEKLVKGRLLYNEEQLGMLDGRGVAAEHELSEVH
jgi:hypothetical protein